MGRRKPIVVGLGELLWDVFPGGRRLGGAVTNFAYHAQVLGGRGIVVSCVGDDESGREIVERLAELDLTREFVAVDANHPTGTVTVQVDGGGRPNYTIHEPVAWDFIPLMAGAADLAARSDAVCFGTIAQRTAASRRTIGEFLAATRPNCLRIFDVNLRQSYYTDEIVGRSLDRCDVLKLNDEELPVVGRMLSIAGSEIEMLRRLAERYSLRLVALTRGRGGSLLWSPREASAHRGVSAQIVDTVGAGDAFTAALAMGLLRGLDLAAINDHANRVAAFVCSQRGATPKLPAELLQNDQK